MNRFEDCQNQCQRPDGAICTQSCKIAERLQESNLLEAIGVIQQAIRDYHYALDLRQHGELLKTEHLTLSVKHWEWNGSVGRISLGEIINL